MATYRQIQISFWQDGFVLGLTPEEKYFYLYLMTNSKTTQCGIYELPKRIIEMETGYNRETVEKLLDRFMKYRKIDYCELTQEILLLNWIKHNSLNSPKVKACIEKELKSVKHRQYIELFRHLCIRYGYSINSLSIDLGEEEEKEEEEKQEEEKQEEEKQEEEPLHPVPTFDNPHKTRLLNLINECQVEDVSELSSDKIYSYIGMVDIEVIEFAIKKGSKKHINYALRTLEGLVKEGKTTKESVRYLQAVPDQKQKKTDPDIEARKVEIARNRWIAEGKNPDDFVYESATGA